jgi:hypothetical protein
MYYVINDTLQIVDSTFIKNKNGTFSAFAVPMKCWTFLYWHDKYGNVIDADSAFGPLAVNKDTIIYAIYKRDSFQLALSADPSNGGKVWTEGKFPCDTIANYNASANSGWIFSHWTDAETGDTISVSEVDSVKMDGDKHLIAHFVRAPIDGNITFTIRASEHKLADPTKDNYRVPIYITSDKPVYGGLFVEMLSLKFNENIFFLKRTDNGEIFKQHIDDTVFVQLMDVAIPELEAGVETKLCELRGALILGNTDSTGLDITEATLSEEITVSPILVDGYITIKICDEGGERLLDVSDFDPGVFVVPNPIENNILRVHCSCVERGEHTLEIVDMLGNSTLLESWKVVKRPGEYDFEFDISGYSSGNYFLRMRSPTMNYWCGAKW